MDPEDLDLTTLLETSVGLIAARPIFLLVSIVFDLVTLLLSVGLRWLILREVQMPIGMNDRFSIRFDLPQALPSVEMIVGRPRAAVDNVPRELAWFVVFTLIAAALRGYGMAGFVGWLDRTQVIQGARLRLATFHLLGRRFFGPMAGYTFFWAVMQFLAIPAGREPLASFVYALGLAIIGIALMFTPFAIVRESAYTLDAMIMSIDFVRHYRRVVAGLALLSFLATATGSYVVRSATPLLGGISYLAALVLWAPVGSVLSALTFFTYLSYTSYEP